jgi:hypothetical protein
MARDAPPEQRFEASFLQPHITDLTKATGLHGVARAFNLVKGSFNAHRHPRAGFMPFRRFSIGLISQALKQMEKLR